MKAIWKSLTFLLIVFSFADNLKAQSGTLNLDDGSIRITSTGYTQGEAAEVTYSGPYTITQTSTVVSNTITVEDHAEVTITLGGVNIKASSPFNAKEAAEVTLKLQNTNTFIATGGCALAAPSTGTLTIMGDDPNDPFAGKLIAKSQDRFAAGIGVGPNCKIIIESGTVNATGGSSGAGIGGADGDGYSSCGEVTIKGGIVRAEAGWLAAGIGGGSNGGCGKVTITGGIVTAIGKQESAGIGGSGRGSGGEVTISGGIVIAQGGVANKKQYAGIGKGHSGHTHGTFSTGNSGNAIIFANFIGDPSGKYFGSWSGLIFEGSEDGKIYGTNYTVTQNVKISSDKKLVIADGQTLTINQGVTLTNEGTIQNDGTIQNNGTIQNDGTIYNNGTISGTGTIEVNAPVSQKAPTEIVDFTVEGKTYNGTPISVTAPKVKTTGESTVEVGTATLTFYQEDTEQGDAPVNAGSYTVKASYAGNDSYKAAEDVIKTFTISKATPRISISLPTAEGGLVYDGSLKEATATVTGVEGETDALTATLSYQKKTGEDSWEALQEENKPTDAGTYRANATFPETNNYISASLTSNEFTIQKAIATIADFTVSDQRFNGNAIVIAAPTVTGVGLSEDVTATLTYKMKDTEDATYTETAPSNAGSYIVKASYTDDNHAAVDVTKEFNITKASNSWTTSLTMEGWTYNEDEKEPSAVAEQGEEVTYVYYAKATDADDYTELERKPTNAGTWYVQAKVTGLANYADLTSDYVAFTIAQAAVELAFAQLTLTITQGDAVPANALTNPHNCEVTYSSDNEAVATVDVATGVVTVVGVGTATITATAGGNYTGTASYTLTVNRYIPPYTPPTDPVYYTVTIPTELKGAIIYGGGTHTVEEYTYCSFRIELDPNGNGEYPTVTKGYWWDTLTPDGQGNYSFMVTGDTEISISEVPTSSYSNYQLTFPTDSVAESDSTYWSGAYIEVIGASQLRAEVAESIDYEAPFGKTVTLRPIETERRKFLQWEDGSTKRERTLTLQADEEINALWQHISPVGIETIVANSVIRGEHGQLYIEVPNACEVVVYNYNGVPVRAAQLAAGVNRLMSLNAGLYIVQLGNAQAVPVRIR